MEPLKSELIPLIRSVRGHPMNEKLQRSARINDYTLALIYDRKKLIAFKSFTDYNIGHEAKILCLGDMI